MKNTSMSRFESLGVYLPEKVLSTSDLMSRCKKKPRWDIEQLTGIKERRVADGEFALDIAVKACENALALSSYESEDIDLIISCSISRITKKNTYCYEPSISTLIKNKIGAANAMTFDVVNACAGMFSGVYVMNSLIKSGAIKCGIVVSGEYITHIADQATREIRNSFDGQLASLTVGDAGAAVIMDKSTNGSGIHHLDMMNVSKHSKLCVAHPSKKSSGVVMMTKPIRLHKAALSILIPSYKKFSDAAGWTFDKIDHIIPHQTSMRAIHKGAKLLKNYIKVETDLKPTTIVPKYGNSASTSHFVALHDSLIGGNIKKDNSIVFMIQASGIVVGQCSYVIDDLAEKYENFWCKEKRKEEVYA